MRNFIRLYLKDYVIKFLSIPLLFTVKLLELLLSLLSAFYRLLRYPVIGFCLLGIIVEATCSPIRYSMILLFTGVGIFFLCFRYLEPFIFFSHDKLFSEIKNANSETGLFKIQKEISILRLVTAHEYC